MKNARGTWILMLFVLGSAMACADKGETADAQMTKGLDSLYVKNDPGAAVTAFRKVLAKNPEHYGANYQLAVALDRSGKAGEARPVWEKSLAMAEAIKDERTADAVRRRLGLPILSPEDAAMKTGLDALYARKDAAAAVPEFRRVLQLNPNHYGATFQLATALDQVGKRAEARPLWEKALEMAKGYKDKATADTTAARLATKP